MDHPYFLTFYVLYVNQGGLYFPLRGRLRQRPGTYLSWKLRAIKSVWLRIRESLPRIPVNRNM